MVEQLKVSRRTLLLGMVAATFGSTLSSCRPDVDSTLEISLLAGAIPAEVLKKFRQQTTDPVKFQVLDQLSGLFQLLQRWQSEQKPRFSLRQLVPWAIDPNQLRPDNLVSLDDYWLASAIERGIIEPFQLEPNVLEKLPADWLQSWQQFIEQSVENRGKQTKIKSLEANTSTLWAAPYKVQPLVVVYRQSEVLTTDATSPFSSWQNLLARNLQNRIALPEHPRLVLGLLQKIRSGSFNPIIEGSATEGTNVALKAEDIEEQLEEQLGDLLVQLDRQVKTYDAENSLKALINGDVDVAVSWLADVVSAQKRYRDLKIAIPSEGSLLSTDVWVRPKGADLSDSAISWINYCWEAGPAAQISRSGKGLSPVFLGRETALPKALADVPLSIETLQNSEPLLPLSVEAQKAYFSFWQRFRSR